MNRSPTSTLSLAAYAAPALPLSMLGLQLIVYLPPFYAQELGLGLGAVGTVFFLARLWDAVIDPVVGNLSDLTRSRWGRRKPWLVAGAPFLMIGVVGFLSPPPGVGVMYLAVTAFLFYVAWTVFQIPYLSWGTELSRDYAGRTRVNGYREIGAQVGTVIATVLPILVLRQENPSLREILGVFVMALLVLIPLSTAFATTVTPVAPFMEGRRHGLLAALRILGRNKPYLRLLGGVFLFWLAGAIFNAVVLFMVQHMLQLPTSAFLKFVFTQYVLSILFVPLWVRFGNRFGRHRALVAGGMAFFVLQSVFLLVTPGEFNQALAAYFLIGPVTSVIWVMPPAMVGDAVEYGIMKGGGDDAALYMATYNFAMKLALALGVGIALPFLGAFGFDPAGANGPDAMLGLGLATFLVPVLVATAGALVMFNYPIDARRHGIVRKRLVRRGLLPGDVP